jgi:hypothetical protein
MFRKSFCPFYFFFNLFGVRYCASLISRQATLVGSLR